MRLQRSALSLLIGCGVALAMTDTAAATPVCFDYPFGESVPDFIKRSSRISAVRVLRIRDVKDTAWVGDNVEFDLEAFGTIKGKGPKRFTLRGLRDASPEQLKFRGQAADHASLRQMTYRTIGGQSVLAQRKSDGACEFVPIMKVGHTYLVFQGGPTTAKSFEDIGDYRTDQWYASVLQELSFQAYEALHREQ